MWWISPFLFTNFVWVLFQAHTVRKYHGSLSSLEELDTVSLPPLKRVSWVKFNVSGVYTLHERSGKGILVLWEKTRMTLTIKLINYLGVGGGKLASIMSPSLPSSQSFHPLSFLSYNSVSQCEKHTNGRGPRDIPRGGLQLPYIPHSTVPSAG